MGYVHSGSSSGSGSATDPGVSVQSLGAVGDGVTDDTAAINAAFAAAAAMTPVGAVYFPPGKYVYDGESNYHLPNGIRLCGAGRNASVIQAKTNPAASGQMFYVGAGVTVYADGLTFNGPASRNGKIPELFYVTGAGAGLRLTDCYAYNWRYAVHGSGSGVDRVECRGCEFYADSPIQISVATGCSLHCRDCKFTQYGVAASNLYHGVYVYPGVSLDLQDCEFVADVGLGNAVQIFNSGDVNVPNYCRFTDCRFRPGIYNGILTNANVETLIHGCQFEQTQNAACRCIRPLGDCSILDCTFYPGNSLGKSIEPYNAAVNATVLISDCKFLDPSNHAIYCSATAGRWSAINCVFARTRSATSPAFAGFAGMNLVARGCKFADTDIAGAESVVTVTSNYTEREGDGLILANANGSAFTVTLKTAVGRGGQRITVQRTNSGNNAVTIVGSNGETINGQASLILASQYDAAELETDGANWKVVAASIAYKPWLDVKTQYGAKGDGSTDDTTAINNALTDADSAGYGTVFFPAGTYVYDSEIGKSLGNVRILGVGDASIIQAKTNPAADSQMFRVAASKSAIVEQVKLVGPASRNGHVPEGFYLANASSNLTLRRVTVSAWRYCVHGSAAALGTVEFQDCTLSGDTIINLAVTACRLHVHRTAFDGYGVAASSSNYAVQCYPGVSLVLKDCAFANDVGTGRAVQIFNNADATVPEYCRIEDCTFRNSIFTGILTNQNYRTLISRCTFENPNTANALITTAARAIQLNGDCLIDTCEFHGNTGKAIESNSGSLNAKVLARACKFKDASNHAFYLNTSAGTWHAEACDFANTQAGSFGSFNGVIMTTRGCRYSDTQLLGVETMLAKSSAYTFRDQDDWVDVTTACDITLPSAVGRNGKEFGVYRSAASGTTRVLTSNSENMDGSSAALTLATQYAAIRFKSNNVGWRILWTKGTIS